MDHKQFFFGKSVEDIHLKRDIFLYMLYALIISALSHFIVATVTGKSIHCVVIYCLLTVYYVRELYLIRKYQDSRKVSALYIEFCFVQAFTFFPAIYITGGGINSGMPLFFMIGGITTILLLDGFAMWVTLVSSGAVFLTVYLVEFFNPELISSYTDLGVLTYMDISLATLTVGLGVGSVMRVLAKNFDKEQEKARELLFQIEDSSTRDPLTGAYNRRYLMDHIEDCIAQVESGEMRAFSLLMFDIDHFKKINDTYGHLAGDDCIRNLAFILKNSLRNVDVVSRYGGEEFICVLPTAEDTPAFRRAEQIRESVELTQLSEDINKKITISGGVVMYTPGMTPEELINEADENLYLAKEGGRNQIVWHKGGIPPLCYVAYDTTVLKPVRNAGRRFSDATANIDIKKV